MGIFGKKRGKTIDLTERYMKQMERMENLRENMRGQNTGSGDAAPAAQTSGGGFDFLGGLANAGAQNRTRPTSPPYQTYQTYSEPEENPEEKKRKLAKRLMDITDKLEEISNQLYHLQQRVEVLEKKFGGGAY